jgi:type II secretory pathway pseudopilin PulG
MLTKIALAAALIVASVSATLAKDNADKASRHARASYAQAQDHARPSLNVDPSTESTGAVRPLSQFEKSWFDFQNHE